MTTKRRRFIKGIKLSPDTTAITEEGELKYDDSAKKLQYRDDSADRSVVSEDGTQTLENKTMDFTAATGNNSISADSNDIAYDNSTSGLTANNVKDAIDELDTRLEGQDEASEISYDNSTSGLTATNVQAAVDEVEGRLDTVEGASYVNTFEGRSGTVTAQSGDYDSNQITYDNSTSGLTATDAQAAIDEVEGRVDTLEGTSYVNTFEGRSGTVTAQSGDYDANQVTYSNATTGYTATDVQAAIDEADGIIDAHTALTSGVHGVTGSVVGTTDTQDLSGKTFTDALTLEEQAVTPATPAAGDKKLYPKTDGQLYTLDSAGNEVPVGAGGSGGSLNFYEFPDAEAPAATTDFTTGNNASFTGGGTLQGTFSISSTPADVIRGDNSYKLVLNASAGTSDDDYVATDPIDIPQGYRGRTLAVKFQYKYDGASGDIVARMYDTTNATLLTSDSLTLDAQDNVDNTAREYAFSFYCPPDCQQVEFGFQVLTHATGSEELIWDDVVVSPDLLITADLDNISDWESFTPTGTFTTNTVYTGFKRRVGDSLHVQVKAAFTGAPGGAGSLEIDVPDSLSIDTTKLLDDANQNGTLGIASYLDSSASFFGTDGYRIQYVSSTRVRPVANNVLTTPTAPITFASGDEIFMEFMIPIEGWSSTSTNVVTANESNAPVKYTTNAFNTVPKSVDSILDFEDVVLDDDNLVTTGASWKWTAPRKGVISLKGLVILRMTASGSLSANQTAILKVFKNGTVEDTLADQEIYTNSASGVFNCEFPFATLLSVEKGDEIDLRMNHNLSDQNMALSNPGSTISIVYEDVKPLSALALPQIAYVKDIQTAGTPGGSASATTYNTRVLNTVEGDSSIVSLSSNTITLQPGSYHIEASAPAFLVANHALRLQNTTDGVTAIVGEGARANADVQTRATLSGKIVLTETKSFQLQHYTTLARATDGLGNAMSFQANTHAVVKIQKVK